MADGIKVVAISDVHGKWNKIITPDCDLLISAGDYSFRGEPHMTHDFHAWLNKQPAKHVISVMGNHEELVQSDFSTAKQIATEACPRVHFIEEGPVDIEGIKIWCSAWTPWFHDWAYNAHRGDEIKRHWDFISDDTEILVTHGPPYNILDAVYLWDGITVKERVGCMDLYKRIMELKKLKCHIFGHIHGSSGEEYFGGVKYINASICDEQYMATNPVRIFEYEKENV